MESEVERLVQAIESLRQETTRDYVYPIAMSFFAALFGGLVALVVAQLQEKKRSKQEKLDLANQFTLTANNCFTILAAIKGSYIDRLNDDPLQRLFRIPYIPIPNLLETNVADLVFIVPKKMNKAWENKDFNNLTRIHAAIQNYNFL